MSEASPSLGIPYLRTVALSKHFGALKANDGIDLSIDTGEVHAILGENGAGKSTLMKLLYGYYQPTSGHVEIQGKRVDLLHPRQGRDAGIGMVFQNFTLIPAMEVWENVALFLPKPVPRRDVLLERIRTVSKNYGLEVDPRAIVRDLPMGDRQKVEIVKILLAGAKVLIFDEPTSVLAPHEAENLFRVFDRLKKEGFAVLFITHKMPEVLRSADRVTVLRKGKIAATLDARDATREKLVQLLVGEATSDWVEIAPRETAMQGPGSIPVLELINVGCRTPDGRVGLEGISFQIHPGEIFGIAAVSGNGQEFLGDLVLGTIELSDGTIYFDGKDLENATPKSVLALGVSTLPEDPIRMGAIGGMSVRENLLLGRQREYQTYGGWGMDSQKIERETSASLMKAFVQSAPSLDARAGDLSGGNLQRVVIARELSREPRLFVSYYLARGLDLSNARAARDLVTEQTKRGMAVLFVTEDLDELMAVCDRFMVLHAGRSAGIFRPVDTNVHEVGLLMTGAHRE